jgi:methylase of polypeptide subunit release factors
MYTNLKYENLRKKLESLNSDHSHFINSNDICTPMDCVEEMVDNIPCSFWDRKNIRILDPCAGNGNFPAYISQKIKHNQSVFLHLNEINSKRVQYIQEFFNGIHLTQKDFLYFSIIEEGNYDLIIANPPYAKFTNGKRTAKNHGISKDFVKKSMELLNKNGFLAFILPDNWMSLSDRNDIPRILSRYQFIKLNIHGAKKYFPKIGSSFTWFVLQKKENKDKFIVSNYFKKREDSLVSLNKETKSIPLFYNDNVKSIIDKTLNSDNEKIKIITSSDLHKYTKKLILSTQKSEDFPYEVVHTPKQTIWSKKPHKFQEGWKVFISLTSYYGSFIKENVGMTQSIAFILCKNKEEALKWKKIIDHPLYIFLNNIHRFGNFNNIRVLQNFPAPIDKNNIWRSFNLNEDEIKLIENIAKI